MHSALVAYEWDRSVGVTFGNVDFQAAIRRYVRKGEFFKGYPTCFPHRDPLRIMQVKIIFFDLNSGLKKLFMVIFNLYL